MALVPPKPKEFESTLSKLRIVDPLAHDRHVGEGRVELLDVGALADEAVVHHQERVDRLLHPVAPSEWPVSDLVAEIGGHLSPAPNTSRIASISLRSPTGVEVACGLM